MIFKHCVVHVNICKAIFSPPLHMSVFSGSRLFPPRNGHHVLRRGRSMSIRIGCSDVVNGLSKSHEDLGTESEAVSSTISTDTEEDERSRTVPATIASNAVASGLTLTPKKVKKTSSSSEDSGVFSSISSTDSEPSVKSKATKSERPKLSKNVQQIEALLRRINEENKKTKEVLDNMGKSDQVYKMSNLNFHAKNLNFFIFGGIRVQLQK